MGLLDALFSNDSGGGLLAALRNNAQYQPTMSGLASDQAQYDQPAQQQPAQQPMQYTAATQQNNPQPSAMDNAQWPAGPNGAPSQANAQMPQPQPQQSPQVQAMPQPSVGIGDRLGAGFQSFANSGGPLQAIVNGIGGAITGQRMDDRGIAQQQQAQTQRDLFNALVKKGVDPQAVQAAISDPDMRKALITQTYGPQTVTPLGNGYVADKSGNIKRAYEPEDKIPAGFAKDDNGNMNYIPGGPADPKYLRLAEAQKKDPNANIVLGRGGEIVKNNPDGTVTVLHKNESEPTPMDPSSLEILARREIGGDFSGRKNLGRGAQGAADLRAITNKSSDILTNEMGMSPKDAASHMLKKQQEFNAQGQGLNAEARTTGVREANLNLILKAADAAIPAALEASDKVARTGWVPLNKIIQHGEVMASDPALKSFGMANLQLAEHWARAMNPTGVMRGEDRDIALGFLGTADSKETYRTAVEQLRTQITRERDAVKSSRGMSELPGNAAPSAPQAGAPKAGKYMWMPGKGLVAAE